AICGKAWPCSAERARLLAKFAGRPDQLGCHLWQELERAARRVPEPAALYERFLVWAPGVLPPSPIDPGLGMPRVPPSAAATRPGDGGVALKPTLLPAEARPPLRPGRARVVVFHYRPRRLLVGGQSQRVL